MLWTKKRYLNNCPYTYKIGDCSKNEDDKYDSLKACYGDNIIYFWKGKKFEFIESYKYNGLTYLKNTVLKNEECPWYTKECGILDDEENKLCLPDDLECPPNVISTKKLNLSNYTTIEFDDNTTIYYAYDKNSKINKIIAGLYIDTDLYINKEKKILPY